MSSILKSTSIVALSTLASRILGFIREMLFAAFFGATGSTDAFFVAFRIPNLMRRLVAEGALTISFIPVYTEYIINKGESESLILAQKTLSILLIALFLLTGLGMIFSPELVRAFAYGLTGAGDITIAGNLTRIMFPYLILVGLTAFSMGVLNSHGYFFSSAFSPVLLNVGIITGIISGHYIFKNDLYGPAIGVLIGGVLQFVFQIPYMIRTGFKLKFSFDLNHPGIKKIFGMLTPALFGIAVYQINILMSTLLASLLPSGSISYLYYSDRLTEMALGIFIVSIGNVILPEMSKLSAGDNFEKLKELYLKSVRAALFLALPSACALIVIGLPIVTVFFQRGSFTEYDSIMTYRALFYSSIGIVSVSILRITTPAFYSLKDTKSPVKAAAVAFVLNITLGYILMNTGLKHAGLALANTISVTVQMLILGVIFYRRLGGLPFGKFLPSFLKSVLSSIIMGVFLYFMSGIIDWKTSSSVVKASVLTINVIAGCLIFFLVSYLLKVEEIRYLTDRLRRKWNSKIKNNA
jgi:putative peptidoglycan lipid II flippase